MSSVEQVEDLKHTFSSKAEVGTKLPNPKDVADKSSFYLKSGDTMIKHRMINGKWYMEKVNTLSQVIFEEV